jgi:hypothetical protein
MLITSEAVLPFGLNKPPVIDGKYQPIQVITLLSPIKSIHEYSKFMIKDLYKYINTDFVLCTQWDAFVLNADAWTDKFLEYDYVGAPWWYPSGGNIGNGGFSLRSKRFLEVCSKLPIKNYHPEDLMICRVYKHLLEKEGIKFAPEELAAKFSFEGNQKYGHKWNGQFGFHDLEMSDISNWKYYNDYITGKI